MLTLVADGADHHCVVAVDLARKPGAEGTLRLTATTVTSGAKTLTHTRPGV
ncbi:hypothetical protein ACFWN1_04245 [Streptomyces sp. NPDC058459]|uniref:hypothetical protein n=1 Tax=Streptomyces sp. NPDC058459 TaxID=3346508 RepID=UPI00365502DB